MDFEASRYRVASGIGGTAMPDPAHEWSVTASRGLSTRAHGAGVNDAALRFTLNPAQWHLNMDSFPSLAYGHRRSPCSRLGQEPLARWRVARVRSVAVNAPGRFVQKIRQADLPRRVARPGRPDGFPGQISRAGLMKSSAPIRSHENLIPREPPAVTLADFLRKAMWLHPLANGAASADR